MADETIEELIAHSEPYTREQIEADRVRLRAAIAAKHGIAESEVDALIREHRYEHSADDIEDEYIGVLAFARVAAAVPE